MSVELPPLPEPCSWTVSPFTMPILAHTDAAMRSYARAAVDAALEAAAVKCEQEVSTDAKPSTAWASGHRHAKLRCIAAIRAMRSGVEHI